MKDLKLKHVKPARLVVFFCWLIFSLDAKGAWNDQFYFLLEPLAHAVTPKINSLAVNPQDNLFMGGVFKRIGGYQGAVTATNIARWDGTQWFILGAGVNGEVRTIVCIGNDVYVGGTFTTAGGLAATNLARWDGTNWWPVGGGIKGTVNVLASNGEELYVGGTFTNVGALSVQNIAKWDGQNWNNLAGGLSGPSPSVTSILVTNEEIFVGGRFIAAGGISATNIATWNGASWTGLGNGLIGPAYALTKNGNNLYAAGGVTNFGLPFISEWDGTTWTNLLPTNLPMGGPIKVLFFETNELYAGGVSLPGIASSGDLIRMVGTDWLKIPAPFASSSTLPYSCGSVRRQNKLYFAGLVDNTMSGYGYGIQAYDKSNWNVLGAGMALSGNFSIHVQSLAFAGEDLIAGGRFQFANGSIGPHLVAKWNGKTWSSLGTGITIPNNRNGEVQTLATDGNIVFAGGVSFPNGVTTYQVNRWDGTNWASIGEQIPSFATALATRGDEVFVGGAFGLQKWDGTNWLSFGGGVSGPVNAIAIRSNSVFVGGSFTNAGNSSAKYVALWNGTNWLALNGELDGPVKAFAFLGDELVVGGSFTNAGSTVVNSIAVWNGISWRRLGAGFAEGLPNDNGGRPVPTSVNSLVVSSNGIIYAAGNFQKADGRPAKFVAYWDGENWQGMDSGLNFIAYALALKNDQLYVGGDFLQAGGLSSTRLALWHVTDNAPRLNIRRETNSVVLWWPTNIPDFSIEKSENLSTNGFWTAIPATTVGNLNIATNSTPQETAAFYRLKKL